MTTRRTTQRPPGRSRAGLAPGDLGDAPAAAAVVIGVAGLALVVTAAAIFVMGLTLGGRYAGLEAPPALDALGLGPILGGAGLLLLGIALAAGAAAVLLAVPRARPISGLLSVLSALLAAAGAVLAMASIPADPIVATSLAVVTLALGVSGLILLRPAR